MIKCVCVGFGYNGFVTKMQLFPMNGYYKTNIISCVGHPRFYYRAMVKAPALYYRSLGIASTLQRMGNILSRPYC
jgi:hypothetical protein